MCVLSVVVQLHVRMFFSRNGLTTICAICYVGKKTNSLPRKDIIFDSISKVIVDIWSS